MKVIPVQAIREAIDISKEWANRIKVHRPMSEDLRRGVEMATGMVESKLRHSAIPATDRPDLLGEVESIYLKLEKNERRLENLYTAARVLGMDRLAQEIDGFMTDIYGERGAYRVAKGLLEDLKEDILKEKA